MKTSKRILGIALAIIMIFNVFAVGVFAAFPDDAVVDLIIKADKTTYAPGETITLTIATQAIPELDMMTIGGQFEIAYPSAVVTPKGTAGDGQTVVESHGFVAIADGWDAGISSIMMPSDSSGAVVPGTDTTIKYIIADNGTAFSTKDAAADLFSVQMVIADNATPGTYTIGFNQAGYDEYCAFSNDGLGFGGLYGNTADDTANLGYSQEYMYDCGTVTFTVAEAASEIIFHGDAMYNTQVTTEETAMLGFVGYFNENSVGGFKYNDKVSTRIDNVTHIGVRLNITGLGTETREVKCIYPTSESGVYNFRAVLDTIDLTQYGDADIVATYFIVYTDANGVELPEEVSAPVTVTANGIIDGIY